MFGSCDVPLGSARATQSRDGPVAAEPSELGCGDCGRPRRRVRRHRHQPDLHDPNHFQPPRSTSCDGHRRERVWALVAGLLVGHRDRHRPLRRSGPSCGQSRRGRHLVVDHLAPWSAVQRRHDIPKTNPAHIGDARRLRRLAVPCRQHDHPGDLGVVCGRGSPSRQPRARTVGHSPDGGDHPRAVHRSARRHR